MWKVPCVAVICLVACGSEESVSERRVPPPPVPFEPIDASPQDSGLNPQEKVAQLDFEGPWVGTCEVDPPTPGLELSVELSLTQTTSGLLGGTGLFEVEFSLFGIVVPEIIEGPAEGQVLGDGSAQVAFSDGRQDVNLSLIPNVTELEGQLSSSSGIVYGDVSCQLQRP
ncbi:MAG: hypothetical protein AAGA48_13410 [Myxococcota bacterium]